MKIIFATNNQNKVREIRALVSEEMEVISLTEAGIDIEIPEPHDTLEANAKEKAVTIFEITNQSCFSEDTGLEVFVLNGEPGVKSARYAGEKGSSESNIEKLLLALKREENRKARFRTVICLILKKEEHMFEGVCEGYITKEKQGEEGFGYDPVFVPEGAEKTFAQMPLEEKNQYSHRRKAMDKLVTFLNQS